jgi:hypothetical protein
MEKHWNDVVSIKIKVFQFLFSGIIRRVFYTIKFGLIIKNMHG